MYLLGTAEAKLNIFADRKAFVEYNIKLLIALQMT